MPLPEPQTCSLAFTLVQTIISGVFGSFGFIVNLMLFRFAMTKWQEHKAAQSGTGEDFSMLPRAQRRRFTRMFNRK